MIVLFRSTTIQNFLLPRYSQAVYMSNQSISLLAKMNVNYVRIRNIDFCIDFCTVFFAFIPGVCYCLALTAFPLLWYEWGCGERISKIEWVCRMAQTVSFGLFQSSE